MIKGKSENKKTYYARSESISCHFDPRIEKALPLEAAKVILSGQKECSL
jgi:hypothetical protein